MALRRPRSRRLLIPLALLLVGALVATGVVLASRTDAPVVAEQQERLPVGGVELDTTLFTPAVTPAPAVLLAHGFGGSKASVADQARALAADGFVVLTWSARGFGASGGQIGINDPDAEVADARALVDHLATLAQVQLDGPGDPRVGVAGASYGGALALSLAGTDPRIDADAAAITWNDLGQALLPDQAAPTPVAADTPAAGQTGDDGVLKRSWAGIFFAAGASADGVCGKFTDAICQGYLAAAASGEPTASLLTLLRERSPAATNAGVRAPTLLLQGETDTLFGLDQADANGREVAAAGAPVLVSWFAGGHDAGGTNADADAQVADFLAFHLAGRGTDPGTGFRYEVPGPVSTEGTVRTRTITTPTYPGLDGGTTAVTTTPTTTLALQGDAQPVLRPPGAAPSSISTVPGLGAALGTLASSVSGLATLDVPGQVALFSTAPLTDRLTVTGTPRVSLDVRSLDGATAVLLFAKLYDVAPDGSKTLPGGGVSPFRVPVAPGQAATTVAVTLPGIVRPVEAGHTLQLAVSTTDQAYAVPLTPAVFSVSLAGADLVLPTVGGTAAAASTVPVLPVVLIAVVLALLVALGVLGRLRRRGADGVDAALADTPLVVRGLEKSYADGFRAVDGVDLTVGAGQVLGLLGPNGAGKTTTLRMLMGLITPSAGEILVFGHRVRAGAPVLSRLGSFVEGAGFLPHLSGRVNLELYWSATGRPAQDAHLDEALAIAGLGSAVERKVRGYSQGMRQRLAIAQAMLGLPDLLVLDEPTNGLDPPQIRAMRDVLRDYAATGRTVLVSSHLLAEVEQTCSHVVVMNKGTVVAAGTVAEIVSADGLVVLGVSDPERAVEVLDGVDGVGSVRVLEAGTVQADLARVPAQDAVAALVGAGVGVSRVAPRNRLEDVFLSLVEGNAE